MNGVESPDDLFDNEGISGIRAPIGDNAEDRIHSLARLAYNAYGEERCWKTFGGDPMPDWEHQDSGLQEAWCAAALAVSDSTQDWALAVLRDAGLLVLP